MSGAERKSKRRGSDGGAKKERGLDPQAFAFIFCSSATLVSFAFACRLLSRVVLRIGRLEHASDIWLKIDFTFLGEVFGKDCLVQELRAHLFRSFRHEIHFGNDKNSHW